jgi:RNA polymerase sigma factor (sigma-70 family)
MLQVLRLMPPGQSNVTPENPSPSGIGSAADHSDWFRNEIHPHGGQLKAYLRIKFCTVRDIDDIVQESYLRVWQRQLLRPVSSAKAFLFAVARHLALDAIRHEDRSPFSPVRDLESLNVFAVSPSSVDFASTCEEVEVLLAAIESLSPRTREVYMLRKLQNTPQKEIAALLSISPKTVQAHIGRANKQCEQFLRDHGVFRDSDL